MKKYYSISFKKPHSGKLYNVLVRAADEIEASKKANAKIMSDDKFKNYLEYGISKSTIKAGQRLTGINRLIN